MLGATVDGVYQAAGGALGLALAVPLLTPMGFFKRLSLETNQS